MRGKILPLQDHQGCDAQNMTLDSPAAKSLSLPWTCSVLGSTPGFFLKYLPLHTLPGTSMSLGAVAEGLHPWGAAWVIGRGCEPGS